MVYVLYFLSRVVTRLGGINVSFVHQWYCEIHTKCDYFATIWCEYGSKIGLFFFLSFGWAKAKYSPLLGSRVRGTRGQEQGLVVKVAECVSVSVARSRFSPGWEPEWDQWAERQVLHTVRMPAWEHDMICKELLQCFILQKLAAFLSLSSSDRTCVLYGLIY